MTSPIIFEQRLSFKSKEIKVITFRIVVEMLQVIVTESHYIFLPLSFLQFIIIATEALVAKIELKFPYFY